MLASTVERVANRTASSPTFAASERLWAAGWAVLAAAVRADPRVARALSAWVRAVLPAVLATGLAADLAAWAYAVARA